MARFVRVPADDDVELSGSRIEVEFLIVVQDLYEERTSLGDGRHRQQRLYQRSL